ncbi:MAG: O-antigen ligase family protein [Candidatus Peribacteraceae bacterium]|nr:O-antigen ligase family protein [Candidatus Peribacteraceae bacterium]
MSRNNFSERMAWWLIATLLVLLPFHAFLFTWLKSFFWTDSWTILIQSWKEILVGILGLLAFGKLISQRKFPKGSTFWLGLALIVLAIAYTAFGGGVLAQKILGLRTATLFLIAFLSVRFFVFEKSKIEQLKKIVLCSAAIVIAFALAQQFLLPADFLKYFGYSENVSEWLPGGNLPIYHLVGDSDTIRLQSTFAGPNQLGAYLLVILPLAAAKICRTKNWWCWLAGGIFCGGIVALVFTFSRSAWLGATAMFLIFAITLWRRNLSPKLKRKLLFGGLAALLGLIILLFSSESLGGIISRAESTREHFEKSIAAAEQVAENPLGLGIGRTAGVAQRFEADPLTPENTYLGVTLELGWLGGLIFLAFLISLAANLNKNRSELVYSLIGIAVVMFFLHPLEDTPTALTFFLLAGMLNSPK